MNGSSTPYQEQYSAEQALVMAGRTAEAIAAFEIHMLREPEAIQPGIRLAELYMSQKVEPLKTAALFRDVQRICGITQGQDEYVTHRLVDLLTERLAAPGDALIELRRLIERYPDGATADRARVALRVLKARYFSES